jgi:hypothetical protein
MLRPGPRVSFIEFFLGLFHVLLLACQLSLEGIFVFLGLRQFYVLVTYDLRANVFLLELTGSGFTTREFLLVLRTGPLVDTYF